MKKELRRSVTTHSWQGVAIYKFNTLTVGSRQRGLARPQLSPAFLLA